MIVFLIGLALSVWFVLMLLMTKATIWVMKDLVKIDWTGQFWQVFVGIMLLSVIFGSTCKSK